MDPLAVRAAAETYAAGFLAGKLSQDQGIVIVVPLEPTPDLLVKFLDLHPRAVWALRVELVDPGTAS